MTLNADRRQLAPQQRREIVAALRESGHSLRAIAGAVGSSKSQVERDLSGVPSGTPGESIGRDGKRYPAKRPIVAAKNEREAERAQQALSAIEQLPHSPVIDVRRAERIARRRLSHARAARLCCSIECQQFPLQNHL